MRKSYMIWWVVIVIVIAVLIISGALNAPNTTIKIGAILPLTGNEASIGMSMQEALNMAVEEINSVNRVDGKLIEVIYKDSKSDPETGIAAYKELTAVDGVRTIFSGINSVSLAIAPLANNDKVDILIIGTVSPEISTAGAFIFRNSSLPGDQVQALSQYILSHGFDNIGIFSIKTVLGQSYLNYFKTIFEGLGGHIADIENYEDGATDDINAINKMKSIHPEAVIALGQDFELGTIIRQSRELSFDPQWFAIYSIEDPQTIDVGREAVNGMIYTSFYNSDATSTVFQQFKDHYLDVYGKIPGPYASLAYDFMRMLAKVMKTCADPTDPVCIKDGLYKIQNYPGVTGPISFDKNGDTRKAVIFKTIKDGKFVRLEE